MRIPNIHKFHVFNGLNSPFGKLFFYFIGETFTKSCSLKHDIMNVVRSKNLTNSTLNNQTQLMLKFINVQNSLCRNRSIINSEECSYIHNERNSVFIICLIIIQREVKVIHRQFDYRHTKLRNPSGNIIIDISCVQFGTIRNSILTTLNNMNHIGAYDPAEHKGRE